MVGSWFLYIDPLKQGLKLIFSDLNIIPEKKFLYIDPLKQGLKLNAVAGFNPSDSFLYIDPLKQGLKLSASGANSGSGSVFIHRSIKTRIETGRGHCRSFRGYGFLYIDPLKQGLKHRY